MKYLTYLLYLSAALVIIGCSKDHGSPELREPTEPLPEHRELVGSLESNAQELYAHEDWLEDCDRQSRSKLFELARALDQRADAINAFAANNPLNSTDRLIPLGPISVRLQKSEAALEQGWSEYTSNWNDMYADYQKIKNTPVDREWLWLNNDVRGMVVTDQDRILTNANMYLDKDSGTPVLRLRELLQACVLDINCTSFAIPQELEAFVASQPYYLSHKHQLESANGQAEWRTRLQLFARRLNIDAKSFDFRVNPLVTRGGANTFILQIYSQDFQAVSTQLQSYVETAWSGPEEKHVRLQWAREKAPDLFSIITGNSTGGRSFVDYKEHVVVLNPGVRVKSISHEIGHVLGFQDNYFEKWDDSKCSYITQTRAEDLMSDSTNGGVLPEHWAALSAHYPEH